VLDVEAWNDLPNLKRLVDEIEARPAATRALALKDRDSFKMEMDADATRFLFPSIASHT
jgi:GST-like protein